MGITIQGFYYWRFLKNIVIPASILYIDNMAFGSDSQIEKVFYTGTNEQWDEISIDSYNEDLTNANRYYYSELEPTTPGNYWHYLDGLPVTW